MERKKTVSSVFNSAAQAYSHRKSQDWASLRLMLKNDDPVSITTVLHKWASQPVTAKALALCFLAQAAEKTPEKLSIYVKEITQLLIDFLKTGTEDLQDHTLIFLINTSDYMEEEVKQNLVYQGLFDILIPMIKAGSFDRRNSAALLCMKLYSDSKPRQHDFIELQGHFALVSLIEQDLLSTNVKVEELLEYLFELVVVYQGNENVEVVEHTSRLKETKVLAVLQTLKQVELDEESRKIYEDLAELLES